MGYWRTGLQAGMALAFGASAAHATPTSERLPLQLVMLKATLDAQAAVNRHHWLTTLGALPLAASAPTATGRVLTRSLNVSKPPAAPATLVKFAAPAGLESITIVYQDPRGDQLLDVQYSPPPGAPPTAGTVTIQQPRGFKFGSNGYLSLFADPGQWKISYVYLYDAAGNSTQYDNGAGDPSLSKAFPTSTFTVVSATPDTTNPTASSGKIITKVVPLSTNSIFRASVVGADDDSGIQRLEAGLSGPNGAGTFAVSDLAGPLASGTVTMYQNLAGQPAGTWTISYYLLCDLADNCAADSSPADIKALFGSTTFTVKN